MFAQPKECNIWGERREPLCCDVYGDVVCHGSARARDFCACFIALLVQLLLELDEDSTRRQERPQRRRERKRRARATETAEEREVRLAS